MRLATWNVNGIRAIVKKNFTASLQELAADVIGIQETKAQDDQVREALFGLDGLEDYQLFSSSAVKKGYSGTAILTRINPIRTSSGIGIKELDTEGRVLHAEFDAFHFVTVYTPNSSSGLKRLPFRKEWDEAFKAFIKKLDDDKPVICCGDLNVAHKPIDLARPAANYNKTPGYTQDEIDGLSHLLTDLHLVDTWRQNHPEETAYSWWSYRGGAREKNVGWRLDYLLTSERLMEHVTGTEIHRFIEGSDHCPVTLDIQL
jgi:exodeoxyribonuclease-3|tara:strand:+ start:307 stop:1083 length:777 start_codon:yes stop_codon:yes gene_type:complete